MGIVGFGEVGSSFARGFLSAGVIDIVAYDDPPGPLQRELALRRAAELDVPLHFEPTPLNDREIVLSSVTQDAAIAAARRSLPSLRHDVIYADVNSLSPTRKREVAQVAAQADRAFVDIAIMGAPARDLHRVPLLAAGAPAAALVARLAPWQADIRIVGDTPGQAAGVKILRSVLTKGLEVLLVESLVAARRCGLQQQVLDSFCELLDSRPARETLSFLVRSHVVHAGRRALELTQSAETVADAGLQPVLSQAVAARLEQLASLGLKERLGGEQPDTIEDTIALLDSALGVVAQPGR